MTGLLTELVAAFAIATGALSVSAAMMGANAGRRLFRNIMGLLLPGGHTRHRTVDRCSPAVGASIFSPTALAATWPGGQSSRLRDPRHRPLAAGCRSSPVSHVALIDPRDPLHSISRPRRRPDEKATPPPRPVQPDPDHPRDLDDRPTRRPENHAGHQRAERPHHARHAPPPSDAGRSARPQNAV